MAYSRWRPPNVVCTMDCAARRGGYNKLIAKRGYEGPYSTVRRFVRDWRLARSAGGGEGYLELEWAPGTCQVGFTNFHAPIGGRALDLKLLVATLPHSNYRQCVALMSQRSECLAPRDFPALGLDARGDGPRQRRRGGQDGARGGCRVEAVLAVQGP